MYSRNSSASLAPVFHSFWTHRHLILQLTKREVIGRYRGSVMGLAWSFFHPLLMLVVYTFVFAVVFKARWGIVGEESRADFALILFVGMIIHSLFAECVNRAPGLILANPGYVKRVVFPLEILPLTALGSALFHTAISVVVLLGAYLVLHHGLQWTAIFFPVVLLPLVFGAMGGAWFLAATGVFVRDTGQAIGILTTVLLFLSPVFYPVSALPPEYQTFLQLNPLTFMIEQSRAVLIRGNTPDWAGVGWYTAGSLTIAWAGLWWFQKTRKGFADVI